MAFQKLIFIIVVYVVNVQYTCAQTELWPTESAGWYYTYTDGMYVNGYTHYSIERDTLLGGKNSQIYSRELSGVFSGLPFDQTFYNYIDTCYILALEDSTLFQWNKANQVFDTLMIYNAEIGTSWYRQLRGNHVGYNEEWEQCEYLNDTILCTLLAKDVVNVNGLNLMRYRIEMDLVTDQEAPHSFYHYQLVGFLELIHTFPYHCLNPDVTMDGNLRCFYYHPGEMDAFEYKPYPNDCDHLDFTDVDELSHTDWQVYPNPIIGNWLTVKGDQVSEIEAIELLDGAGRKVEQVSWNMFGDELHLQTPDLSTGFYLLRITTSNKSSLVRIVNN